MLKNDDEASLVFFEQNVSLMITLCHRLRSKLFTNFSSCLELYLYQDDTRRRVIDILNKLDLTISYDTILRRLTFLVAEVERRVVTLERLLNTIVTYDNFDYVVSRREKRVEDAREVRFITTALIFERRGFVMRALYQEMWQSRIHLLSAEVIARKLSTSEIYAQISKTRAH
jgi:hypothetical protein